MKLNNGPLQAAKLALVFSASILGAAGVVAQTVQSSPPSESAVKTAKQIETLKALAKSGVSLTPNELGNFGTDNVFTAVTPCRIVDTRASGAGGKLAANTTRTFDVDGSTFTAQGGFNGSCGIPFNVASAVAMTITVTNTAGPGFLTAWALGTQPNSSVINFVAGQTIANTTIVPVLPGNGADFSIYAKAATDVIIDVVGFFAAPVATALDCTSVASAVTTIPNNAYTPVDAICPAGYSATGGGTFPIDGTLGRPNVWLDGSPTVSNGWRTWVDNQTGSNRSVQTYAVCCRIPGR